MLSKPSTMISTASAVMMIVDIKNRNSFSLLFSAGFVVLSEPSTMISTA